MAIENGDTVRVHYIGTLSDGREFDSSRTPGREPLEFVVGMHQMIPGFEEAVKGRECGDRFVIEIPCEQAYGKPQNDLIFFVDRDKVPANIPARVGVQVELSNEEGTMYARITEVTDTELTLDANHELAGEDLTFDIEIVSVN